MDYFYELATAVFRHNDAEIVQKFEDVVALKLRGEDRDHWLIRDERAREILAECFHRDPSLAVQMYEGLPRECCPAMIRELAQEIVLKQAEMRHRTEFQHIKSYEPRDLETELLGDPDLAATVVEYCRLPANFGMVLARELQEIDLSRKMRAECHDYDAEASLLLASIRSVESSGTVDVCVGSTDPVTRRCQPLLQLQKFVARLRLRYELLNIHRDDRSPRCGRWLTLPARNRVRNSPFAEAERMNLVGLAFSGGGIRSATFNLGVLQALSDLDLLRKVDYLSGVSGGSYIAAWLAAWCKRQPDGVLRVQRWLAPLRSPRPDSDEVKPIYWLRRYSNYLTPAKGFFSADTWAGFSLAIRNALLNQFTLVSALVCGILLVKVLFSKVDPPGRQELLWKSWPYLTFFLLLVFAGLVGGASLASFGNSSGTELAARRGNRWQSYGTAVMIACLVLGAYVTANYIVPLQGFCSIGTSTKAAAEHLCLFAVPIFLMMVVMQWREGLHSCFRLKKEHKWIMLKALPLVVGTVITAIASAAGALAVWYIGSEQWASLLWASNERRFSFGVAAILAAFSAAWILYVGFMGVNYPDERREWWSRTGGWLLISTLSWTAASALVVIGGARIPVWWGTADKGTADELVAAIGGLWAIITGLGVALGRSTLTSADPKMNSGIRNAVASIAPYIFIIGLLLGLSAGVHYLVQTPKWYAVILAGLLAIGLSLRFDVNEFSMHHYYRNRLVRCYLGATHKDRNPHPWTGFDVRDDVKLADLRVSLSKPYLGPYLIVNTTLNLVAGDELAWQDRKGASFVFTPLYCGFDYPGRPHQHLQQATLGYRPTSEYAYSDDGGPGLGTCIAISGAAANPNMGYHSSPALTFLMTVFNARLGWWMGNPRREKWEHSGPPFGLLYLLSELFGQTNDRRAYVNLSDGGHFENIGIYELVRRRCKVIIACDAEQDRDFSFGGIGDAIRKCRTDFGVDINLNLENLSSVELKGHRAHYSVGTIKYPGDFRGTLIYVKSSLTGDEPADVRQYALREKLFPHHSTADQFFDEAQFESYRALGQHVASTVLWDRKSYQLYPRTFQEVSDRLKASD